MDQYTSALNPIIQLCLDLRRQAIAELDPRKSLEIYKEARKALKSVVGISPAAAYLMAMSYGYGGWGKYRLNFTNDHKRPAAIEIIYSNENKYISYRDHAAAVRQHPAGTQAAQTLMRQGDFLPYEAIWFYNRSGIPLDELTEALRELGSPVGALAYQERGLRPFLTGMHKETLLAHALVSDFNTLEVFRIISCARKRTHDETNIADFLIALRDYIEEAGRDLPQLLLYLFGWVDTQVLADMMAFSLVPDIRYAIDPKVVKKYYLDRRQDHQLRALTWMCCAKGLVCRDVATMIGRLVYEERWIHNC